MSQFDELPGRDRNHEIKAAAIAAFQTRLAESGVFILQGHDRKDYGADCQIEVMLESQPTNARVQVKLKEPRRRRTPMVRSVSTCAAPISTTC